MISFDNVSKFILTNATIHIPKGKVVGVIGKSGVGKTTMLKLACGLLDAYSGKVYTNGMHPVKDRKRLCKNMRIQFADMPCFSNDLIVSDALNDIRHFYSINMTEFEEELLRLLKLFEVEYLTSKRISELSFGQRRRVELVSLLLGKAEVYILDEATIGLDEKAKEALRSELLSRKRHGATILVSSHNMSEIDGLCDRIILLEKGNIIYYGDQEYLLKKYAPINTMEIIYEGNLPDMEDVPVMKYDLDNHRIKLQYNSAIVSAAEITRHIVGQTKVVEMCVHTPELSDVILSRKGQKNGTLY